MLDAPIPPPACFADEPAGIEWANWASRSLITSKVVAPEKVEPLQEVPALPGGATEMVPRLADRGGWELEFRIRAMQHLHVRAPHLRQTIIAHTRRDLPTAGVETQVVVRVLAELAKSRGVREISRGHRFDPNTVRTALLALSDWIERESRTAALPSIVPASESKPSVLATAIEATLGQTSVEPGCEDAARSAVSDAAAIARREFPNSTPSVELTEEGVLTLQWQTPRKGLMVVFVGDGTATYSIREPGGWYSASPKEFSLNAEMPHELHAAIREVDGA